MDTKTCTKCGETKPVSEFHPVKGGRFGVRGDCKDCHRRATLGYYHANRDALNAAKRERYAESKDVRERAAERLRKFRARQRGLT